MKVCSGDPLVCIDFIVLFIGEFLKDWTTMAMLAALLGLLLKLRADKQQIREDQYAKRLEAYDERRNQEPPAPA
jgi:hypothetical protein